MEQIKIEVIQPESIRPAVEKMIPAFNTDKLEAEEYMEMVADQQVKYTGHVH